MNVDSQRYLLVFDNENYNRLIKLIEKDQQTRDKSYNVWKETQDISKVKLRKRKEPIQYQIVKI